MEDGGRSPVHAAEEHNDAEGHGCTKWHALIMFAIVVYTITTGSVSIAVGTLTAVLEKALGHGHNINTEISYVVTIVLAVPCLIAFVCVPLAQHYRSLYVYMACLSTILAALSLELSSCVDAAWPLFVTFSLTNTVAVALQTSVATCLVTEYFPVTNRYHILATAGVTGCIAVPNLVVNPLLALLQKHYGWRVALRLFGATVFVIGMPVSVLMRSYGVISDSAESSRLPLDLVSHLRATLIGTWQLASGQSRLLTVMWLTTEFIGSMIQFAFSVNIVVYINRYLGFKLQAASNVMIAYSITFAVVVLAVSAIGDKLLRGRLIWVLIAADALALVAALLFAFIDLSHHNLYVVVNVLVCMYAACQAIGSCLMYAAAAEITGVDMLSAISVTLPTVGLGVLCSPLIGGLLFDHTSTPVALFYAQIAFLALNLAILVAVYVVGRVWSPVLESEYEALEK